MFDTLQNTNLLLSGDVGPSEAEPAAKRIRSKLTTECYFLHKTAVLCLAPPVQATIINVLLKIL